MASIPERALEEARRLGLDLSVNKWLVPTAVFTFQCLEPKAVMLEAFKVAHRDGFLWVRNMPIPVVTHHRANREFRIMDGMARICSAQKARYTEVPALVASGETYEALRHILDEGYYGEDFIEMLAMVNPLVRENLELRDRNKHSA